MVQKLKPGQIIAKFKTKKGKEVLLRMLDKKDLRSELDFINTLAQEDTFIARGPKNKLTLEEERKWLNDHLAKIKKGEMTHIVAEHKGKIVGNAEITREEAPRSRHLGEVKISVSASFRGEGLGQKMLETLFSLAKSQNYKLVHLSCFCDNKPAISLYKKLGFLEFGLLPRSILFKGEYTDTSFMYREL